ncbi:MAG TPA: DEAD/DEAH box helicase [Candidatus Dormibacteraeota bacterium]
MSSALEIFSPAARAWFEGAFEAPTEVQAKGWGAVAAGRHTLMTAPTGSGKTLAAFFYALDKLSVLPPARGEVGGGVRVLYVSPLKALAVDVERNLRAPLQGIRQQAVRMGLEAPDISVAIRSGDTPSQERRQIERTPPDILITTPESLFLLLTSAARRILTGVETVIVDEIHSVASTKRGAHLALSLERLAAITTKDPQRIGLSATQRPLEEVGRFLGGPTREVEIVDAGRRKTMEITVEVPVDDMADLERGVVQAQPSGSAAAIGADEIVQRKSIWPAIHPRLLELIQRHRSTIVFVNSRRLAERLATRLNELAEADLVKAHHGSIAREQRMEIEEALKSGRLKGIVATSSLELGIDMGAVDLVIQVEAPPSVAAGMQRIGRSGHSINEISRGTIFPKYRGDLLETAAVVEGMLAGDIEATRVLKNPIDVLAQHIVAMSALDEWKTEDLKALVRRTYSFESLGDRAFEAVLDMLAGRYPSDDFVELRPRIVWDRVNGTIRGRAGAQRLAVTNAGTIPDRGLYTVNLLEDGRKVGELDEEMVFESRPGETFVLGASTWRIADITPNQVLVVPAPGEPGKIAFWKADALARPVEVGRRLGRVTRELAAADPEVATARLMEHAGFDERAAGNLLAYLRDQLAATGALPDDRTIVVERFRDEVGDWRVCILTPYGGRVHAPWALALQWRLSEKLGMEVQSLYTDDGLALRFPDADEPVALEELMLDPEEVRELVTAQLPGSAMFASHFRESAARALLLPRRRPGQRTPLWQQRQRSASLLQVAGQFPDFPILAETFRECLSDEFDLDALQELLTRVRARQVRVVQADTDRASPFSGSLLFDYVGAFLYEGDAPLAERRAQALTLDRELLAELLGSEELRELLDPEAIQHTELELQGLLPERFPRDADEAHDLLARLGDLAAEEAAARGVSTEWLEELVRQRRAVRAKVGGEWRFFAAEDAGRYRDALAVAIPPGLPLSLLEPVDEALESLLRRYARTHVPFLAGDAARRWKLPVTEVESALQRLVARGELLSGEFHPGGASREFCHPEVLRIIRRRSLAALRRETEPVEALVLARFLPQWHGIGAQARGLDRLLEVIFTLQGLALPASVIERDVLAARVRDYMPNQLDELVSMGEVVWAGRGPLGTGDGRVALYMRGDAPRLLTLPDEVPQGNIHVRLRERLGRGAAFFRDLYTAAGGGDEQAVLDALWDLVWAGEVTNDVFSPVRALGPAPRRSGPSRRPRLPRLTHPRGAGRWSLVADLLGEAVSTTERLHAEAGVLLQRQGVLTREAVVGEGWAGGFAALYPVLRAMEEAGKIRRGYFVQGLGGSQFALPGAVDRLRGAREPEGRILALAATDPANPYGTLLPWPATAGRPARAAGAYVVVEDGELKLYLERGGRSLLTFGQVDVGHVVALLAALKKIKVEVQRVDGIDVHASALAPLLREAGFGSSPRGMVFWPRAPRSA